MRFTLRNNTQFINILKIYENESSVMRFLCTEKGVEFFGLSDSHTSYFHVKMQPNYFIKYILFFFLLPSSITIGIACTTVKLI